VIDALTNPVAANLGEEAKMQSFHAVVPSIPGFGFSDAVEKEDFGSRNIAGVFHALMKKWGYEKYIVGKSSGLQ